MHSSKVYEDTICLFSKLVQVDLYVSRVVRDKSGTIAVLKGSSTILDESLMCVLSGKEGPHTTLIHDTP